MRAIALMSLMTRPATGHQKESVLVGVGADDQVDRRGGGR